MEIILLIIKRILVKFTGANFKISFSQTGEDLIIHFIINSLKIDKITYLDIGANHPFNLSNTYLFYLLGMKGVCIEPDPKLSKYISEKRKRDKCINIGIGINGLKKSTFYLMDNSVFNTFSKEEATRLQLNNEAKIIDEIEMKLVSINDIIKNEFESCPDFISLDVEGIDLEIMKEFDFSLYRPKIFCIETITYSPNLRGEKMLGIITLLQEQDYKIFADTYVNTIFVDKKLLS